MNLSCVDLLPSARDGDGDKCWLVALAWWLSTGTADNRALARADDDGPPLTWDVEVEVDVRADDAPSLPRDVAPSLPRDVEVEVDAVLDTLVDLLLLLMMVLDAMDLVSELWHRL